jgi:hypothetical protein
MKLVWNDVSVKPKKLGKPLIVKYVSGGFSHSHKLLILVDVIYTGTEFKFLSHKDWSKISERVTHWIYMNDLRQIPNATEDKP